MSMIDILADDSTTLLTSPKTLSRDRPSSPTSKQLFYQHPDSTGTAALSSRQG